VNSPWKGQASCPAPGEPSYADGGQTAQHGNLIRFRRGGFGYKSCFIRFVNRVNLRVTLVSGAVGCLILGLITVWLWPEKVPLLAASMAGHARLQNRERWYQDSHKPPPTLLEIKTAAENGDAQAQNTLAQVYASQQDFADAVNWYRKAAEQGSTNAQFALGEGATQVRPRQRRLLIDTGRQTHASDQQMRSRRGDLPFLEPQTQVR